MNRRKAVYGHCYSRFFPPSISYVDKWYLSHPNPLLTARNSLTVPNRETTPGMYGLGATGATSILLPEPTSKLRSPNCLT